eukprot:CAMPEP_0183407202 /NCGR_PEP_ID=MMETSP0370-20130417/17192_1 /TAXON_ID=268820 /ORGANISM="Peridinium aciculiferum, Strain PAER-2" /LENGTH=63 /DNA_ID=CAMNT_0025589539 /DNA_START=134 /DNA_END=321 /DNA_ORIENTATION=+
MYATSVCRTPAICTKDCAYRTFANTPRPKAALAIASTTGAPAPNALPSPARMAALSLAAACRA